MTDQQRVILLCGTITPDDTHTHTVHTAQANAHVFGKVCCFQVCVLFVCLFKFKCSDGLRNKWFLDFFIIDYSAFNSQHILDKQMWKWSEQEVQLTLLKPVVLKFYESKRLCSCFNLIVHEAMYNFIFLNTPEILPTHDVQSPPAPQCNSLSVLCVSQVNQLYRLCMSQTTHTHKNNVNGDFNFLIFHAACFENTKFRNGPLWKSHIRS